MPVFRARSLAPWEASLPGDGSSMTPRHSAPAADDAWAARVSLGVQRGNQAALAEFYAAWFDRGLALAKHSTSRDESFCLDVVQDAMLKAASSLKRVETEGQLSAWMRRVLISCAMDRLREEAARTRRQRAVSASKNGVSESGSDARLSERLEWLERELGSISADEAALLRQRFANNRTLKEAGELIGTTDVVAHGRIRRLIEALRRAGKARFGDA